MIYRRLRRSTSESDDAPICLGDVTAIVLRLVVRFNARSSGMTLHTITAADTRADSEGGMEGSKKNSHPDIRIVSQDIVSPTATYGDLPLKRCEVIRKGGGEYVDALYCCPIQLLREESSKIVWRLCGRAEGLVMSNITRK